jgi:protocatechuate 3,4-dioxygenase beta subunit
MTTVTCGIVGLAAWLGAIGGDGAEADPPAKARGPSLQGRITDEAGRPLEGARVILYGGIATRWRVAETVTGGDGRYRFDEVRAAMVKDEATGRWDQFAGFQVRHPTHVPADGKSWRDVRIPGIPEHVETFDLRMTPGGHVEARLAEAGTGRPLAKLDLRVLHPPQGPGSRSPSTYLTYATTDEQGTFRSDTLFPGEYQVQVNSGTLDYPEIGRVQVEAGRTSTANFADVTLPRVIAGRVVGADGQPIDGVEVTLLAPDDSDVALRSGADELQRVRSRAWAVTSDWNGHRFELAFLPGLEEARFVLAAHKRLGWAKVSVTSLERNEPIRLRPWPASAEKR